MSHVFIIAEAGVNHNGDLSIAKRLVDAAVECGADAVKFQSFKAEKLVSRGAEKAQYQLKTTPKDESHFDMLKRLELSERDAVILKDYCYAKGIMFMSTPFDEINVEFLGSIGMNIWKLSSGAVTDFLVLKSVGLQNPHRIILSTGMSDLEEVSNAIQVLLRFGALKQSITLLHCNTEYPTPFKDVNLRAMLTLKEVFGVEVGYSDHTMGIEIPIAAAALGASVIEKHITLDRGMQGPDHRASLEPEEFREMVLSIRNVEIALGDGIKRPSESEKKNIPIARKSIVALKEIKKGDVFSSENLTCKRPGTGLSPMAWEGLLGRKAKRDYFADELIDISEIGNNKKAHERI